MRIFNINWQEPVEIKYKFDKKSNTYSFEPVDLPDSTSGVYQIIAYHPLYGDRQTIYIGKAADIYNRNNLRFQEQHVPSKFWRLSTPILIGIGLIFDSEDKQVTDDQTISDIEALLIARHMPALNSKGIDRLSASSYDLLLLYVGHTNGLLPDCAGNWFSISE